MKKSNQKSINQVIGTKENDGIMGISLCPHYSAEGMQRRGNIHLKRIRNWHRLRLEGTYSTRKQNYKKCLRIVGKGGMYQ